MASFLILIFAALLPLLAIPSCAQSSGRDFYFQSSDGVKLHGLEAGQGPNLVFVPGWMMPAGVWEKQIDFFSKEYHVVALDPRSQGDSQVAAAGHDPLRRSADIHDLAEARQLKPFVLIGWSLGAIETLAYLKQYGSEGLYAVALVDGPLAGGEGPDQSQKHLAFLQRLQADRPAATQDFIVSMFKKPPAPELIQVLSEQALKTPTQVCLDLLTNMYPSEQWNLSMRQLKVPIYYAVTTRYQSAAAFLAESYSLAKVEVFEDAGHALFLDDTERFNQSLNAFLQDCAFYAPGPRGEWR